MSITRYFNLVLNAGTGVYPVINVNQFDRDETWVFTLYTETGTKYSPSTGSIVGIKADGFTIDEAGEINDEGQVVIVETQQMTACAGEAVFELRVDGDTHGTANFVLKVEASPIANGVVSDSDIPLIQQAVDAADRIVNYGSPYVANISSLMTDHKKVYVYTGNETGYTNGNWYYWNGSAWTSGGVYNAQGINTDTSLSISGMAADAKVTGDALDLKMDVPSNEGSEGQVLTKTATGSAWATGGGGGGGGVVVDSQLSFISTNPVQNKVISSALADKVEVYEDATDSVAIMTGDLPITALVKKSVFGSLSDLVTTAKNTIVAALNEVAQSIPTITLNRGHDNQFVTVSFTKNNETTACYTEDEIDDILGDYVRVREKVDGGSGDVSANIQTNKFYIFGTVTSLTITLVNIYNQNIFNEYHFMFTSGSTATVLTLPNTVVLPSGFQVEANKVYEVSIVENYATVASW